MNTKSSYTLVILALPLLLLLSTAVFNYAIDPYQIHAKLKDGNYQTKPAIYKNMRLHKAYQITKVKPDALIIGTSKAIQGYPLTHPYFKNDRVYNAGLTLATTEDMYHYLQHARAQGDVKKLVLTLDFIAFNTLSKTKGFAAGFQIGRMHTPEEGAKIYLPDYANSAHSMQTKHPDTRL